MALIKEIEKYFFELNKKQGPNLVIILKSVLFVEKNNKFQY